MKPLCVSFVEQDPQLAEQVLAHLQSAGMQGHHSPHHDDFQSNKDHEISDVVVLDSSTLGEQSFALAAKLAKHPEIRVVMIAPATEPNARIAAIDAGADVCISKPFNPSELVAIIQRLASRLPRTLKTGWTIDPVRALLTGPANNAIGLTAMETVLLTQLALAPEQALRSDALEMAIWGLSDFYNNKRLQVCVSRLRKKLTHRHGPEELLATCWRSTYQFVPRMHFAPKR
ncbi:MAG: Phosphate regulon transcriptional regulatory protein PhoB [Pseudomonadota bacterium]